MTWPLDVWESPVTERVIKSKQATWRYRIHVLETELVAAQRRLAYWSDRDPDSDTGGSAASEKDVS